MRLSTTTTTTVSLLSTLLSFTSAQQQQQGSSSASSSSSSPSSSTKNSYYSEYGVLGFDNFGFEGYYRNVKTLDTSSSCQCELASNSERTIFKGVNAPLNSEVSVHFRGPLTLNKYGFYTTSSTFHVNDSSTASSVSWDRIAYYDGDAQTADNVTFLTAAGDSSPCLGKALTYADSDGTSKASSKTTLANGTLITSDQEFMIFSNVSCAASKFSNDCGVYRDGIPAFKGFSGVTKMFLFEFEMPQETQANSSSFEYYDMPAIWLLNARIPRTSQYPTNENCSCWATGCGEFDIFEVMNGTESNHMYSTIHDYQGTGDIGTGLVAPGYIGRNIYAAMKGGVVFDSEGSVAVFLSNSTTFDDISGTDVLSWISTASSDQGSVTKTLVSATNTGSGKVSGASKHGLNKSLMWAMVFIGALFTFA